MCNRTQTLLKNYFHKSAIKSAIYFFFFTSSGISMVFILPANTRDVSSGKKKKATASIAGIALVNCKKSG